MTDKIISRSWLQRHRDNIFVFGDNIQRVGYGGAATLRDEPNAYGFITKKFPSYEDNAYYKPSEYSQIYMTEINRLKLFIARNQTKRFLISKLGAGLANKYKIFENVIEPNIRIDLKDCAVEFLW